MNHVDIHSHLAWDLDDGLPSIESCRKLLLAAQKDHITKIVATPHFVCGKHQQADIAFFQERISELKTLAKDYSIEIHAGSELFINDLLFHCVQNRLILPIEDTGYVLCEFNVQKSYDQDYDYLSDHLYELVISGYIPILAHVERYFEKKIDIEEIREIVDMGCLIQVNTSSILYPDDTTMKKNITALLDNNLVHVIATDSHNYQGRRCPNMSEAFTYLSKSYDASNLELLFYENPLAIVSNQKIQTTKFTKQKLGIRRFFK